MKNIQKILTLFVLIVLTTFYLPAQDFGVILDQTVDFTAHGTKFADSKLKYSGILIPRFSTLLGDNAEIMVSAGLNYYVNPFAFVPELLRTDFTMRFGMGELKAGRMPYRDPSGLIAEGLFDGAHFSYDIAAGTLSAGAWYAGLQYKERANITMTKDEQESYKAKVDYGNFADTYFAPRRALASLGWEHAAIGGFLNAKAALLGQFDFTGEGLNTQYVSAKAAMQLSQFLIDLGGCFELIEYSQELTIAMAGELGLTWILPTRLEQLITLRGRFTTGATENGTINSFQPLTTVPQGELLKARISGLSVISLDYIGRLHRSLSLDVGATYFLRSDLGTYTEYPVIGIVGGGNLLGMEACAKVIWSVTSDLQMNLGIGTFLPSLGNAAPKADPLWRAELGVVLMLF